MLMTQPVVGLSTYILRTKYHQFSVIYENGARDGTINKYANPQIFPKQILHGSLNLQSTYLLTRTDESNSICLSVTQRPSPSPWKSTEHSWTERETGGKVDN